MDLWWVLLTHNSNYNEMNQGIKLESEHNLGPLTVNEAGEKFLFNLNRHGFDRVRAVALFDARFGEKLFNENTLHIIIGTDSGLLLRYVQSKSLPNGARYIFIEPESVLQVLQEYELLGDQNERIACIRPQDWAKAIRDFKIADYLYINAVSSFNAICAQDDFINEYAELSWDIVETLSQLHWENNTAIGQEAFIDRQIKNVADNRLPAKLLQNAFRGQTVVLLAGGPSLNDALPWVKLHRRKFVVFAVSRISRHLLAEGIEPDFIFSVDPQDISFDIGKEMFNFGPRTVFIYSYHAVSTLVSQWAGLMFYLGSRLPWDSESNVANLSGAGPTVTNTALNVAYDLGFNRVILAGVDLCYTRDGFTHAKGSNEQLAGPKLNLTSLQVETNGGFLAPTGNDYFQAIKSLGVQAKKLNAAGAKVINGSPGAARIDGVVYIPLDDIQLEETYVDAATVVATKVNGLTDVDHYLKVVLTELRRAEFQIQAIGRLAQQARRINDAMYGISGVLENYKDKKQLDRIEKKFKREHRGFAKLVKRFGIRQFMKAVKPFSDQDWTAEEAKKLGDIYYESYQEGAKKLLQLIEDAIQRVVARQQENAAVPDFDMLFEQWNNDKSFGRARLWRAKHQFVAIPQKNIAILDEFEAKFLDVLGQRDTRHIAIIKKRSNLAIVRQRASLLFKHKKTEGLRDLLASLDKHAQQDAAIPYRYLIDGYLAELENNPDQSLDAYHQIIKGGDVLLEEALIRIAFIGIENDDAGNVGLALQCLSQLNPVYLPFYAEVQRLKGDLFDAVDTYSDYINQFPSDTLVQLKLAMLYMECKVHDSAEMMLDFILQQKPDHEVAIAMKRQLSLRVDN